MERRDTAELSAERQRTRILDALVEQSQDQLVYLDRDFNFLCVNRAYVQTCRRAPEAFIGHNHFELYPHAEYQAIFERVRDTGEPHFASENPFVFPDQPERGTTYWDWTLVPDKDQAGRVVGLVLSLRDVTERVRTRQRIEESEQRFCLMAEGVPDLIWVTDAQGKLRFTNQHERQFFGARSERVEASQWARLLHPEDAPFCIEEFQRAVRERTSFRAEVRVRRADGAWRWLSSRAEVRLSPSGEFLGHVGISTDVTERKRVDEALRKRTDEFEAAHRLADRERRRLEAVIEALPVGVAVTDAAGGTLQSNQAFDQIWRGPRPPTRTAANHAARKAWWPETGKRVASEEWASARAIQEGETVIGQLVEIERLDGSRAFVINSAAPVHDAHGELLGSAIALQDVTELRSAQQALHERERSLREADQRKNEFLAMLSHELRNPLAPIRNSLFILDSAAPGGEQARRAKAIIDRQVGQLARLVDDLLDVTRINRGKFQIQRGRFDLSELIHRTAEDHRSMFAAAGVEFEVRPGRVPLRVNADAARIAQAVGNLLQNAAKFTGRGGRATLAVDEEPGGMAAIRVRDTGVGIAPEVLPRLFQPFSQADSTLDRSSGGLGLGLALVRGLAELHGGSVEVHSDGIGTGTEFTLRLPLERETAAPGYAAERVPASSARGRVLIIEDNADAADSLREVLELAEHSVEVAHDGPDGLEKARAFRPEYVLCDIGLPGMNGYEVARAFRADPVLRSTFLVALTGHALPEDLVRARDAGFSQHLAKPLSLERLERILSGAPAESDLSSAAMF